MQPLRKLLSIGALLLCGVAHAQVLYQSGFEAPPFAPGALGAQDGWSAPATIQTGAVLEGRMTR